MVYGLYLNFTSVRKCLETLKLSEIQSADVSVLLRDGSVVSATPGTIDVSRREKGTFRSTGPEVSSCYNRESAGSALLIRNLLSLGVPVYDSERLEERIRNGGILLIVRCNDMSFVDELKDKLIETGAQDISLSRHREPRSCPVPRKGQYPTDSAVGLRRAATA